MNPLTCDPLSKTSSFMGITRYLRGEDRTNYIHPSAFASLSDRYTGRYEWHRSQLAVRRWPVGYFRKKSTHSPFHRLRTALGISEAPLTS